MKKLFAVLLSLCLLCACAAAEEVREINYWDDDIQELAAQYEGDFLPVGELGLYMFVPGSFTAEELTEEQAQNGLAAAWTDGETGMTVKVTVQDVGGMSNEEFTEELKKDGAEEFEAGYVNGLEFVSYDVKTDDGTFTAIVLVTEEAQAVTFSFGPMENEAAQQAAVVMGASICSED